MIPPWYACVSDTLGDMTIKQAVGAWHRDPKAPFLFAFLVRDGKKVTLVSKVWMCEAGSAFISGNNWLLISFNIRVFVCMRKWSPLLTFWTVFLYFLHVVKCHNQQTSICQSYTQLIKGIMLHLSIIHFLYQCSGTTPDFQINSKEGV